MDQPASPDAMARLQQLTGRMSTAMAARELSVMLLVPGNLTVHIRGRGYVHYPHIGGESFIATRVVLDQCNRLIFCFKPALAQAYEHMEMTQQEAQAKLQSFRQLLNTAAGGDFHAEVAAIRRLDADARALATRINDYPAFGSF